MILLYTIISVLIVSVLSLVGILTISINHKRLDQIIHYLVSFAVGSLLGGAFVHLIPETIAKTGNLSIFTAIHISFGILIFFSLEKFVRWRHCHNIDCDEHSTHLVPMNLFGDALHNFIDGLIIGTSYLVGIPVGIATTLAVAFHELPQEIGDFGVLLQGGLSKRKALLFNYLTALTALIGGILAVMIGPRVFMFVDALIPITAGGFIYIACSDLIPELHRNDKPSQSLLQILCIILGIAVMIGLKIIFQ